MSDIDNDKISSARAGARRLIDQVPKVFAGLAGLCGVAYLAGSIYTRAYFSEFNASWILEEVPAATYFSQSWVPLLVMLYLGYLVTTNLALIGSKDNLTVGARFKLSMAMVQYGSWFLLVLLAIAPLLSTFGFSLLAIVLSIVALGLLLLLLSAALELVVVRFRIANQWIDLSMTYIAMVVIATGLYIIPAQLGLDWARMDKQPTSSLFTVYLLSDPAREYRLLFSVGERLYIFPATFEGNSPLVQAVVLGQVSFVPPGR